MTPKSKFSFPIVGIAGGLNTGKGTVAQAFLRAGYMERNFADPLKRVVRELFNVPTHVLWGPSENRTPEVRAMLQELGTDYARKFRPNIWVDKMEESLSALQGMTFPEKMGIVIADIRFENEIQMLQDLGACVIRLKRPGNAAHLDDTLSLHASETTIDQIPDDRFQYVINNDGTLEDLEADVQVIIEELRDVSHVQ